MFDETLTGRRVRLVYCSDPYTRLAPGTLGTVQYRDDAGTLHVNWDGGSTLGLIEEAGDRYDLLPEGATA